MRTISADFDANSRKNLTPAERVVYIVAGLGLAATATKPRPNPLLNALALIGGSYLAWRGYMGDCPIKAALFDRAEQDRD